MRTKILKTLGLFVLIVTLYSCNDDSNEILEDNITNKNVLAKPINIIVSLKNPEDDKLYELTLIETNPLVIRSDFFKVKKTKIKDSKGEILKESAYVVVFEDSIVKPQIVKSDIVGYEVIVRPVYQLDTSRPDKECWIYGTWYEDTVTGDSFFLDASYISQALNNVCSEFGGKYA